MENRWYRNGYVLRPAEAEDVMAYCRKYDPLEITAAHMTCQPVHNDPEMMQGFFHRALADESYHLFLLFDPSGNLIGETALHENDDTASLRICIYDPKERGKGLGSWAVHHMMEYAFDVLDDQEVNLAVLQENAVAIALYRGCGFHQTGKEGRMLLMRCRRYHGIKKKGETCRSAERYRYSL